MGERELRSRGRRRVVQFVYLGLALLIALVIRTLLFQPYTIPSACAEALAKRP